LGAILTQNTTWHNAALALQRLRRAGCQSWPRLRKASLPELEACVRPAGFFRQKARTIRLFVNWLEEIHGGALYRLFSLPAAELRRQLLELYGLGPETVDAIILYAGRRPFFVADSYTRRILSRHGLFPDAADYTAAQQFLHRELSPDAALFGEFHALLVEVGKRYCKRREPLCSGCPLESYLPREGRPQEVEFTAKSPDDLRRLEPPTP
jgi:endonuclease-3 related protein